MSFQNKKKIQTFKRKLPKLSKLLQSNTVERQQGENSNIDESHCSSESAANPPKRSRVEKSPPSNKVISADSNEPEKPDGGEDGEVLNQETNDESGSDEKPSPAPKVRLQFQSGPFRRSGINATIPRKDQDDSDPEVALDEFFQKWNEKSSEEAADVMVTWLLVADGDAVRAW